MAHSHDHGHHGHAHGTGSYNRAFAIGIALNLGFVIVEATYGILAHSIALLADAGHNSSDVLSLVLAWGASVLTRRQPSRRYTYGLRGSSILISLLNAILLLLAMGAIAWEAVQRFHQPSAVAGGTVIGVAAVILATQPRRLYRGARSSCSTQSLLDASCQSLWFLSTGLGAATPDA